ncbi:MAG TPA: cytidine/deoxycytidylate deaminase family protein [Symbiobacteriaceae bacterium]|nr:cytidine/deoxycytidylate deaminase family protein [Symbiobacteriaceae bacterium]
MSLQDQLSPAETHKPRPSWDQFFLGLAEYTAQMATCPRLYVGACLVRHKQVLSLGFNGAPAGHPHCTEIGCLIVDGGCLRTRHAEINAIMQAVQRGIDLKGATVYLTHSPCPDCARALIREGIERVVFRTAYRKPEPLEMLQKAGIQTVHLPE